MGESLLKYFYQIHAPILGCGHSTQFPLYGGIITQVFIPNSCSNIGLWPQHPVPSIWGNHYSSISTKFMLQYLGCGHSTQIPVYGIITQVFLSNPWPGIGLWAQYPVTCIWESITQVSLPNPCSNIGLWPQHPNPCIWNHYSSIPTKSLLLYWAVATAPSSHYMGESLLKYFYQIHAPILGCGHSTQIPVYGIITQVFLPNPWSHMGMWAQYKVSSIWWGITQVFLPNPWPDIGLWAQYPHPSKWESITQVFLPNPWPPDIGLWAQYPHPSKWESITQVFLPKYSC